MSRYMIVPAILVVMAVGLVPLFALINYSVQTPYEEKGNFFVGFDNFKDILTERRFIEALQRNLILSATVLALEIPLGLALALLLYEKGRLNTLISIIIVIPALIPPITVGLLWRLLIRSVGPIAIMLSWLNVAFDPFRSAQQAYWIIIAMDIWHWTSLITIVCSAGLAGMDKSPILSAKTEGATRLQIFRHIELPAISFPLVFVSLLRLIDSLKIYDEVIVLTGGGPGLTNEYISLFIKAITVDQWFIGFGAAASLFYTFIVLVLCYILMIVMTRGRGLI